MGRQIRIKPFLGLGNRMFQHMLAEIIRNRVPDCSVSGPGLPEWEIEGAAEPRQQAFALVLRGHTIPLNDLIDLMRRVPHVDVYLASLSARLCHYAAMRSHFQAMFPISSSVPSVEPDYLVINVRLGEILAGAHPNYMPLPIDWYRQLIEQEGLTPLFMGQLGSDPYTQALRRAFPQAEFQPSLGPRADFDFIARAPNLVLPISTFSWLASWLSPMVQTIHLPVAGLFDPGGRPDHDLLPIDDPRYRFHDLGLRSWNASPEQFDRLMAAPWQCTLVIGAALKARYPMLGTEGLDVEGRAFLSIDPATHSF